MNPHHVLGVQQNATLAEIKKAYKRQTMKHHPDKGGDPSKFHQVKEAFELLRNVKKRTIRLNVTASMEDVVSNKVQYLQLDGMTAEIVIPPSVNNGNVIKYSIRYDTDLLIQYSIAPSTKWTKDGLDLQTLVDVDFWTLICGGTVVVTNIYGKKVNITIPSRTKPLSKFRVSEQGACEGSKLGDLYVVVNAVLPNVITDDTIDAITKIR